MKAAQLVSPVYMCVCVCEVVVREREFINNDNNYCFLCTGHSPQTAQRISVDEKPLSGNNSDLLLLILFLCLEHCDF